MPSFCVFAEIVFPRAVFAICRGPGGVPKFFVVDRNPPFFGPFFIFKLWLGASIGPVVGWSVCLSVGLSVGLQNRINNRFACLVFKTKDGYISVMTVFKT